MRTPRSTGHPAGKQQGQNLTQIPDSEPRVSPHNTKAFEKRAKRYWEHRDLTAIPILTRRSRKRKTIFPPTTGPKYARVTRAGSKGQTT